MNTDDKPYLVSRVLNSSTGESIPAGVVRAIDAEQARRLVAERGLVPLYKSFTVRGMDDDAAVVRAFDALSRELNVKQDEPLLDLIDLIDGHEDEYPDGAVSALRTLLAQRTAAIELAALVDDRVLDVLRANGYDETADAIGQRANLIATTPPTDAPVLIKFEDDADDVRREIRQALEGESNDDEHDALVRVAEALGLAKA